MAVAAPPRSLQRPASAPAQAGQISFVPIACDATPGRNDPPFDAPPRTPRTGGDGGGGGNDDDSMPRTSLPAVVWVVVAAVAVAVPTGFLVAAYVHRGA